MRGIVCRVPGRYSWLGVLLVGLICLLRVSVWVAASFWGYGSQLPAAPVTPILATGRDHLLLYAFSYTDPEFLHNLEYFIRNAVIGDTVADHIIIVQEGPDLEVRQYSSSSKHQQQHDMHRQQSLDCSVGRTTADAKELASRKAVSRGSQELMVCVMLQCGPAAIQRVPGVQQHLQQQK
jgi:hypothetical protein